MITLLSEQDDSALAEFQVKILSLAKDGNAPGIVIDISALEIVDRYELVDGLIVGNLCKRRELLKLKELVSLMMRWYL